MNLFKAGSDVPSEYRARGFRTPPEAGRRRLVLQKSVGPFPSSYERSGEMAELAGRASEFFQTNDVDWKTVVFEVDREAREPFDEVWIWKAWTKA